ncbi:MAG TPA: BON domain-containing protein [Candidatus Polarisedimenticolaceae bacterium]|nr:BON domain-containing protein [Candidatus Polarisedimenticolaceae bacterium]
MTHRKVSWLAPIAAVLLTAACAHTDVGITTKVKTKIAVDDTVRDSKIVVTTENGVVTLTGNIDSADAKARALALARETKGVVEVRDMIEVRTASTRGEAPEPDRTIGVTIDDAGTTIRVKTRLMDDPLVKAHKIDVDTRDGVVFLTGSVGSEKEKDQAIKLTRETKGVKDVQANLTIKGA